MLDLPLEALAALCRRYQIRELSLFGSAMRDDFRPGSDLDLLVTFDSEAEVGFLDLAGLQREPADLFGRSVDLVPKQGLKPIDLPPEDWSTDHGSRSLHHRTSQGHHHQLDGRRSVPLAILS